MNLPQFSSSSSSSSSSPSSSKKELQLQGTRPPPLRVSKESHTIRKPPLPPTSHHHPAAGPSQNREPLIIYSVSPKVLHVTVSDFMNVVQRLTGPSSSTDETASRSGDVSPAARLASIERTSPTERERAQSRDDDMTWLLELEGIDLSQFPGILSPAPATLPPISQGYFSPVTDTQTTIPFWHDMSPFWSTSPSGLLSAGVVSPLPSPDLFNIFD